MNSPQPILTELEQEVFDYLNDTPNAREAVCKHCAGSGYDSYNNYSTSYPICPECEGKRKTPAARIETLAARISHELDIRYSEAKMIVEKWRVKE